MNKYELYAWYYLYLLWPSTLEEGVSWSWDGIEDIPPPPLLSAFEIMPWGSPEDKNIHVFKHGSHIYTQKVLYSTLHIHSESKIYPILHINTKSYLPQWIVFLNSMPCIFIISYVWTLATANIMKNVSSLKR